MFGVIRLVGHIGLVGSLLLKRANLTLLALAFQWNLRKTLTVVIKLAERNQGLFGRSFLRR